MAKYAFAPHQFQSSLITWYAKNHRLLPWRETQDPYHIWISEIMLQQTTVQAVIPFYKNWLRTFPDMVTLAKAPIQAVLRAWQGLGYYARARNLHAASKIIVESYGGKIPNSYEELRKLPGFGPYTTAAVLSLVYDAQYPVIDANVRRILMRLTAMDSESQAKHDDQLLKFLTPLLPAKGMGQFNQAMMELGALLCKPKNPSCLLCPFPHICQAYIRGIQEVIPRPQKRSFKRIEAVVGIIRDGNKFLIQKRPSTGLLAGLWEFPGGKIKPHEKPDEALKREIKEELGVNIQINRFLVTVSHSYTQFQVTLHAYECTLTDKLRLKRDKQRWVTLKSVQRYPLPSGSVKIIRYLENRGTDPEFQG